MALSKMIKRRIFQKSSSKYKCQVLRNIIFEFMLVADVNIPFYSHKTFFFFNCAKNVK